MKTFGAIPFFNEPIELIKPAVESLLDVADHVYMLDGAWKLFPLGKNRNRHKTDSFLLDQIASISDDVTVFEATDTPWPSEPAKKTAFLDGISADSSELEFIVFFLDADERIEIYDQTLWREVVLKAMPDVLYVNIYRPDHTHAPQGFELPRLFKASPSVYFKPPHDFTLYHDSRLYAPFSSDLLDESYEFSAFALSPDILRIRHDRALRTEERVCQNGEYQRLRREVEGTA